MGRVEYGRIIVESAVLREGFVQVPVTVLHDPELSAGAKLAYATMLWYAWRLDSYPGDRHMASDLRVSERSIRNYLSELRKTGWIQIAERGLGQTTSYILPEDKFRSERQDSSALSGKYVPLNTNTSLHTLKTNTKDPSLSFHSTRHDKPALIATIASEIGPNEPQQAIQTYLGRFSATLIARAAEITRANSQVTNPIAYLYGVIQRLQEQEATQTAAHQHVEVEPELTEEEYQVSLQALERVKQQLSQ